MRKVEMSPTGVGCRVFHDALGPAEPSLTEMTQKALDILSKNRKGYFLKVEAGRIDHAHHSGHAYRALTDVIELSNAVKATLDKVDRSETLVIVTEAAALFPRELLIDMVTYFVIRFLHGLRRHCEHVEKRVRQP